MNNVINIKNLPTFQLIMVIISNLVSHVEIYCLITSKSIKALRIKNAK